MADIFEDHTEEIPAFEDLVGDGKKFKTTDDIAKKVFHSDKHISELEKELQDLRTELRSRTNLEDLLKELKTPGERTPASPPEPGNDSTVDLQEEVRKLLRAEKTKEQADSNVQRVREGLKTRFGDDYNNRLATIATELNVPVEFLREVGVKSPDGFFKLIDSATGTKPQVIPAVPQSRVDAAHMPEVSGKRTKKYYDEIRHKDINQYFSKKVQQQMHADAMEQGSEFYN